MTAPTPVLPADPDARLRRLRLGAMRRLAPELLITAKTQRWAPEEFLRTLIKTEITSWCALQQDRVQAHMGSTRTSRTWSADRLMLGQSRLRLEQQEVHHRSL